MKKYIVDYIAEAETGYGDIKDEDTVTIFAENREELWEKFDKYIHEDMNYDEYEVTKVVEKIPTLREWEKNLSPEKRAEIDRQAAEADAAFERSIDDMVDDSYIAHFPEEGVNTKKEASQMKKTNLSGALTSALTAEQILNLVNEADLEGCDPEQAREIMNAVEALKEQMRIDKEYTEDVPAPAPKAEAPKHILKDASNVGCTTLIDTAFVPDCHDDDDDEFVIAANNIVDDDDEKEVVQKGFRGDPEDGMHHVILVDYPERQQGKNGNGDYRIFHLRDCELFNEWTLIVSESDLNKRLQEISYNNRGMLAGMTKKRAFASLMVNPVFCWSVKNLKGKVVTYFDEVAYTKYFTWVQTQKSDKEFAYATKHSAKILAKDKAADFAF